MIVRAGVLTFVVIAACDREQPQATPSAPPSTPPPALQADPAGSNDEPTHGDASLPFTITKVERQQERRLAPPFHADRLPGGEVAWTYVEAMLGGGTFGWLVREEADFKRIELVPTTTSEGARVVEAFAHGFQVYLPKPRAGGRLARVEVPVTFLSRANGWITTTWQCEDAAVFVQFNLTERRGRFVQKNRNGTWDWANCLARALRDGSVDDTR